MQTSGPHPLATNSDPGLSDVENSTLFTPSSFTPVEAPGDPLLQRTGFASLPPS